MESRQGQPLFTSTDAYKWVNPIQVWGIEAVNLADGLIEVVVYSA